MHIPDVFIQNVYLVPKVSLIYLHIVMSYKCTVVAQILMHHNLRFSLLVGAVFSIFSNTDTRE